VSPEFEEQTRALIAELSQSARSYDRHLAPRLQRVLDAPLSSTSGYGKRLSYPGTVRDPSASVERRPRAVHMPAGLPL
jgi:hypothetical protein